MKYILKKPGAPETTLTHDQLVMGFNQGSIKGEWGAKPVGGVWKRVDVLLGVRQPAESTPFLPDGTTAPTSETRAQEARQVSQEAYRNLQSEYNRVKPCGEDAQRRFLVVLDKCVDDAVERLHVPKGSGVGARAQEMCAEMLKGNVSVCEICGESLGALDLRTTIKQESILREASHGFVPSRLPEAALFAVAKDNWRARVKQRSSNDNWFMCGQCKWEFMNISSGGAKKRCYIATACYGSEDHPDVELLRRFRDQVLSRSALGRSLVAA